MLVFYQYTVIYSAISNKRGLHCLYMHADVFWDLKIYIFLRRSLAHISYMYIFFFCRYIWGSCPPPPNTKSWLRYCFKTTWKIDVGVLVHQDNAPAHKSVVAMAAVRDSGFVLVDHPPYSPDLAPSEYFLFPDMKNKTRGREAVSDRWWGHICSWGLFRGSYRMRASLPREYKRCSNTDGKSVWTPWGDYVNK